MMWTAVVIAASLALGWAGLALLSRGDGRPFRLATPLLFGALLLWCWEVGCRGFRVPRVLLPPPSGIVAAFATHLPLLGADFVQTVVRAVVPGYALGCASGFLVALALDRSRFLQRGVLPLAGLLGAMPIVGIAPIAVMWFGFDWPSKAAVAAIMTFFPMLVNTLAGLSVTSAMERDLMRSYGASYGQTLVALRLPAALPFVFTALKLNFTLALIGAIVAEFFGTPIVGMGFRISTEAARLDLDVVWAEIALAALTGSLCFAALAWLESRVLFWHPSFQRLTLSKEVRSSRPMLTARVLKCLVFAGCGFAITTGSARAADRLTLQLKWVAQAQFAGYYVAQAKGYYKAAGLDVTIKPGGPDINPAQIMAGGGADVDVDWMPSALATREKGVPLVNIAQVFQKSGLEMTCRKESGVKSPADFKGKTLGVWYSGNEYPFLAWMSKLGYKTTGGPDGVTVLKQGFNVDPLLQKQAACISTMTYNEYWQLIEAGMQPDQLTVFKYQDEGVSTLEDGLYAKEAEINDPVSASKLARFVKASMRGWQYAIAHQDEAVTIVLANDTAGAQTAAHQKRMMSEIAKLVTGGSHGLGYLDDAAADRTVKVLLAGSSEPVITKKPVGAWTHVIWDKAQVRQARRPAPAGATALNR